MLTWWIIGVVLGFLVLRRELGILFTTCICTVLMEVQHAMLNVAFGEISE